MRLDENGVMHESQRQGAARTDDRDIMPGPNHYPKSIAQEDLEMANKQPTSNLATSQESRQFNSRKAENDNMK